MFLRQHRSGWDVFLAALGMLCLASAVPALAAPAHSFETREFLNSTGLRALDASAAYALGFTGKGVIVGVIDDGVAEEKGEFSHKYPLGIFPPFGTIADPDDPASHGIHVGGIIAANKNGYGMHGVAFDAGLFTLRAIDYIRQDGKDPSDLAFGEMLKYPEIKIINNSWGSNIHADGVRLNRQFWIDYVNHAGTMETVALLEQLVAQGKLLIFASGNEGHLTPGMPAGLPDLLDKFGKNNTIANNWLVVGAFDPTQTSTSPMFIAPFSNLGQVNSEYFLLAPGVQINSTISPNTYHKENGTSMAAPYVAGVAALTQQAFPYMDGKQIADVLLSTATPLDASSMPKCVVLYREEYNAQEDHVASAVRVYTSTNGPVTLSADEVAYLERMLIEGMGDEDPTYTDSTQIIQALADQLQNPTRMSEKDYRELFGQGIVNAGRAVQGPGFFNAARLDPVKDLSSGEFGGNYALYGVNSQGYDSIWSNNIGQKAAQSGALNGLDVGLRKSGQGVLYLTGQNTYAGPTVVEGGAISLGISGLSPANRPSLAGDVYVQRQGAFTGNGIVAGNLESGGLLAAGLADRPGSVLDVLGKVESRGETLFILGQSGRANSLHAPDIAISGTMSVAGNRSGELVSPYTDYLNVLVATNSLALPRTRALGQEFRISPFLAFSGQQIGNTYSLIAQTSALDTLPGLPEKTRNVATALESMFHALDGPGQRRLDYLYNQSGPVFSHTAAAMRGDIHAATITGLPFEAVLPRVLGSNPGKHGLPVTGNGVEKPGVLLWAKPIAGYSRIDGDGGNYQHATGNHRYGLLLGLQRQAGDIQAGLLAGIGYGELRQGNAEAEITDTRFGLYSAWTPGAFSLRGVAAAGFQHYETKRGITVQNGGENLRSDYDGWTLGGSLDLSYNLLHGHSHAVALSPSIALDVEYISQDSRTESGDEIFGLKVRGKDITRSALRARVNLAFSATDWLNLSASVGYKRLLSGNNPELKARFQGSSAKGFAIISPDESRNFLTWGLGAEAALPGNFSISAGVYGENARTSEQYTGFLNLVYKW